MTQRLTVQERNLMKQAQSLVEQEQNLDKMRKLHPSPRERQILYKALTILFLMG